MSVIEHNCITGETSTREYTQEELDAIAAAKALWDSANTQDLRAIRAIDGLDKLQLEHLFDLENRIRALEAKQPISKAQYRNALIARWKELNL